MFCFQNSKRHPNPIKVANKKEAQNHLHGVVRGRIISTPPFVLSGPRFGSGVYLESNDPLLCFCPDILDEKLDSFFLYPAGYASGTSPSWRLLQHLFPIANGNISALVIWHKCSTGNGLSLYVCVRYFVEG